MELKKYNTVLFDWDGTLAQTIPIWEASFMSVFDALHMPINVKDTTEKLWLDSKVLYELGIDHSGFFDLVYEKLGEEFTTAQLYPGVLEMLKTIHQSGLKTALVTSTRKKSIQRALQYNELETYFQIVITSEDVTSHKPNPEPYELALTRLSSQKDEALIVGDSMFDLMGSINSGLDCALFLPKENEKYYNTEELIALKPAYVIKEYEGLLKILKNNI